MIVVSVMLIGFGATVLATGIVMLIIGLGKKIGGDN